ncbi:hypothetical protein [Streptomyces sp. CA-253872]|uniref:hypothetical protein n=1 Tax=Streptomyces sp. CA-253872 TaxID=3240067 RepID=UPI003D8D5790
MSFLTGIGIFGLAAVLTVALFFGTREGEGGKVKLSWGTSALLALLAGSCYKAAGFPFDILSSLITDAIRLIGAAFPKLTMPALALLLIALALFKKWSRREISLVMIFFFYVASSADGAYGIVAARIAAMAKGLS